MTYQHPNTNSHSARLGVLFHLKDTFQQPVPRLPVKCLILSAARKMCQWTRWIYLYGIVGLTVGMILQRKTQANPDTI